MGFKIPSSFRSNISNKNSSFLERFSLENNISPEKISKASINPILF
jgi:hypothetical protein